MNSFKTEKFIQLKNRRLPVKIQFVQLGEKENGQRLERLARLILRIVEEYKQKRKSSKKRRKSKSTGPFF